MSPCLHRPARGICLFLHGAGGSSLGWLRQLRAMPPGWTTVAPDLPGPGPAPVTVEDYAARVRASPPPPSPRLVVVGHSLGGAVALLLALDPAFALDGLVLVGTAARFTVDSPIVERFLAGEHRLAFGPGAPPTVVEASHRAWQKGDLTAARAAFAAAGRFDARGRLAGVTVPTLVIAGEADRLTPPSRSRELAREIPGARLELLAGAGHMPMLEQPEEFNRLLGDFLRALER